MSEELYVHELNGLYLHYRFFYILREQISLSEVQLDLPAWISSE